MRKDIFLQCSHFFRDNLHSPTIAGQLISKNLSGTPIQYTYNKDGNLHKIESSSSKKELQISNSYSYDRKGNITSAYSLQGKSVQRTYNPFNQITKEIIKDGEGTYTLEYSYDRRQDLKLSHFLINQKSPISMMLYLVEKSIESLLKEKFFIPIHMNLTTYRESCFPKTILAIQVLKNTHII